MWYETLLSLICQALSKAGFTFITEVENNTPDDNDICITVRVHAKESRVRYANMIVLGITRTWGFSDIGRGGAWKFLANDQYVCVSVHQAAR